MTIFNAESFRQFLGEPTEEHSHIWGKELRYKITEGRLIEYQDRLRETLYHHHSSFDLFEALKDIGYTHTAIAMRQRNDGNPSKALTRKGNLGEVIGDEFIRAYLGFETHSYFPKRFNPNVDESIRGVDIIGLNAINKSPLLLIGEAKCWQAHTPSLVLDAYRHLNRLDNAEQLRFLRAMKEYLRVKDDQQELANIDRHLKSDIPRQYLIVSITQNAPLNPFETIDELFRESPLPDLLTVHIQICQLTTSPKAKNNSASWLTKLFEP